MRKIMIMDYKAEYAAPRDLQPLSHVFAEVLHAIPYYNDLAKENEKSKYSYDELVTRLQQDERSAIIIKDNQHIAAFCLNRFDDYTIWLEWFGVLPPYRGKQLSRLLLAKLEQSASERNCHKIWCDSRSENLKSISILMNNGYEKIALVKNHWYAQDFYLLQKFL